MIWDKLQREKKQLAKYLQMSLYIQPHSTANEASSSLSTFKDASIFIIQKGGSQCKPRHKLNIILSLNFFYCRKSCYCVRWVVCLDKSSTSKKGVYTSNNRNRRKWRFKSIISSLASQNIV